PPLRPRHVEVTAPDPRSLLRPRLDEPRGERVVRHHHVRRRIEGGRARPREGAELLERFLGHALLTPLERVMEPGAEGGGAAVAVEALPRRIDADLLEERDEPAEDLGDPAHLAARADVQ